jgi:uncharacterized membrane-anchored protein YitT (DUF2179 family)
MALACGMVGFLSPNKIATGGTAGLSIILHSLFGFPMGVLLILTNLPLLFIGIKHLGRAFVIRSVVTIFLVSALIDFFTYVVPFPALSNNLLLATLYGGLVIGIGIGLIFKGEASAGGASIVAKILEQKFGLKASSIILGLDAAVVIGCAIVFKNIELALWSLIGIYASAQLIDLVVAGNQYEKIVHISSENLELLGEKIVTELGLTGTIIKGKDINSKLEKDLILLVIETNRIAVLKRLIEETDPTAYMVLMEASELTGPSRRIL